MKIKKVGIVGAGTMGAGIAAHLANSNIPVVLLDIVTPDLGPDQHNDPEARNRLVHQLFDRMATGRPVQLGRPERADLIKLGNIEDDLELLDDCDWVIEVIIEQLEPKRQLMERLEKACRPDAVLSSNTSGIPIAEIAAGFSDAFRARFLGTHFFNPPRYLKLLEIIPTADTDPALVEGLSEFARTTLGKGVVICKDTPNFIANRFGAVTGAFVAETALAGGYSVADTDALLGPLIGRPRTGYFRLADLVGLDVRVSVLRNLYDAIPHDPYRPLLQGKTFWPVYDEMIARGWLGNKTGQGFYKKEMVDGRREFWTLDPAAMTYQPPDPTVFPSVEEIKNNRSVVERIRHLLQAEDEGAKLVRHVIYNMLSYAAWVTPEIAYSLEDVDNVIRWGFNYEIGPFELWDALGVAETAANMAEAGHPVAEWIQAMLSAGHDAFYRNGQVHDFETGQYAAQTADPYLLSIASVRESRPPLSSNDSATLHNMGDEVLLLEFHSKANTLDREIFALGREALERLGSQFKSLVIANEGRHFSAGARLSKSTGQNEREAAEAWLREGQEFMMALKQCPYPIVTAPHGRTLGGGAELSMSGRRAVAVHELTIGLVEFNVGRVPAWTGCLELLRRRVNPAARQDPAAVGPILRDILSQLMNSTVSGSAWEAKSLGYLREDDLIVMNPDHRLRVAKETALQLVESGDSAPEGGPIYAAGAAPRKTLLDEIDAAHAAGQWTEFDAMIGRELVRIFTGGESVTEPAWVDPWHILDLERAASLALRFDPRSVARMEHMLATGRPLRN